MASARGIDGRSLNAWRMNLAGRAAPRTTAPRRRRATPTQPAALALVELVPAAASAKDVAGGGRYVLDVAGARVEFDDHCSVATLRRVLEALAPLDVRGSFDALVGAVRHLGLDPVDGHLYLFLNKRRRIAKAIWFDGSGWCVLAKRLEAGSFQLPPLDGDQTRVSIDGSTFA